MPWVVVLVVAAVAALWFALGPWVLVLGVAALLLPRVGWQARAWLRPEQPRRVAGIGAAALAVLAAVVVVVPDGWLPIPPSPGVLVLPDYVGRPAVPDPIAAQDPPQHPHLAPDGSGSVHGDAWASDAYSRSGPLGRQPGVDTAWYGAEQCPALFFDSRSRVVGLCGDPAAPLLRVIDPEAMRPLATKELPPLPEDAPEPDRPCGAAAHLDEQDRVVLATTDRRVFAVRTSDAEGHPDLTTDAVWDLTGHVAADDCVVALLPDWGGRTWFVTRGGLVGTLDPRGGRVRTHDLGEGIDSSLAVDETGGVYVVTRAALHRLTAGPDGTPRVTWRTPYDRGTRTKAGQPGQGSGTTPTIIDGGVIAITDNAEPRMHVLFVDRSTGVELCRAPVFEEDASASADSLASLGSGVVVANSHGYAGPSRTLLGRGTSPGLARVELEGRECRVTWTSDLVVPSSGPRVSWRDGLVYAWTKRPSWWGVSAWYLTAVDAATGRTRYSVRGGTGAAYNNDHAPVSIAPDGAAWVSTLAGLVRVRDRQG